MSKRAIVTRPKNVDAFSTAFRSESLCVSFRTLALSGPEGSFNAYGMLHRKGTKIVLECTPKEGEEIPKIAEKEIYTEKDQWTISGKTISNLKLSLGGIFSGELLHGASHKDYDTGSEYEVFVLHPQWINVERDDHVSNEKLESIVKDEEKRRGIIELRKTKGIGRFRALIANTKLRFQNSASTYLDVHPYFSNPAKRQVFDCLKGESGGYRYGIRQVGEDLEISVSTTAAIASNEEENRIFFDALISSLAFLQGDEIIPYRISYERNGHQSPDMFKSVFAPRKGRIRPCAGVYECADKDDLASRILETSLAYYLRSDDPVVDEVREFHWQLREAAYGTTFQRYAVLHLCAIFEGVSKLILKSRLKWSKGKLSDTSASDRFQATCEHFGIPWDGEFKEVVSVWKRHRNSLAHGDFFCEHVSQEGVNDFHLIGGGILALILAEMGWKESFSFKRLKASGFLYYKGSDGLVYRDASTSHY